MEFSNECSKSTLSLILLFTVDVNPALQPRKLFKAGFDSTVPISNISCIKIGELLGSCQSVMGKRANYKHFTVRAVRFQFFGNKCQSVRTGKCSVRSLHPSNVSYFTKCQDFQYITNGGNAEDLMMGFNRQMHQFVGDLILETANLDAGEYFNKMSEQRNSDEEKNVVKQI